jgi:hypothetical protein
MKRIIIGVGLSFLASSAFAQSPYTGMQTRPIKALSEAQVSDLKAGRGMGLALAAELNGYPGPAHVLELADKLALTSDQRAKFDAMFLAMKSEAVPLGEQLIALESTLDRTFADRSVTSGSLIATTAQIADILGKLRKAHLKYHLTAAQILTSDQRRTYAILRGYAPAHQGHDHRN